MIRFTRDHDYVFGVAMIDGDLYIGFWIFIKFHFKRERPERIGLRNQGRI